MKFIIMRYSLFIIDLLQYFQLNTSKTRLRILVKNFQQPHKFCHCNYLTFFVFDSLSELNTANTEWLMLETGVSSKVIPVSFLNLYAISARKNPNDPINRLILIVICSVSLRCWRCSGWRVMEFRSWTVWKFEVIFFIKNFSFLL